MTNSRLILLNNVLKAVMWFSGLITSAQLAGQLPSWATPYVPLVALIGTAAGHFAKTPSQAIAAAVPPSKTPTP
jgi:hypothetical protein